MNHWSKTSLVGVIVGLTCAMPAVLCFAETHSVCIVSKEPGTLIGHDISVAGTISLLGEITQFNDETCPSVKMVYVEFAQDRHERTPRVIASEFNRLRKQSGIKWPYKGQTVMRLDYRFADVVFRGKLILNSEYTSPLEGKNENSSLPPSKREIRSHCRYLLIVNRIERFTPSTNKNA